MHRLFYSDIDTADGYKHLYKNNELDEKLYNEFIHSYINTDSILIYVNSQEAIETNIEESYSYVKEHVKNNRVRIADPEFKAKIILEPSGVGIGALTSSSSGTAKPHAAP